MAFAYGGQQFFVLPLSFDNSDVAAEAVSHFDSNLSGSNFLSIRLRSYYATTSRFVHDTNSIIYCF